jgi:hypothetical protein
MKFAVWLMATLVVLLLAGVLPAGDGHPDIIFRSPVFIALLVLLALSCVVCCIAVAVRSVRQRRFGLKQAGLILSHLSAVLILSGAFLRFAYGRDGSFLIPVAAGHFVSRSYDGGLALDFGVSGTDLQISYYDPTHYDYFAPDANTGAHEFRKRVSIPPEGPLLVDDGMQVERSKMQDKAGNWSPFYFLPDGSILQANRTVKHYSAVIHFKSMDDKVIDKEISVNHPVTFQNWRFYLMSAKEGEPYIVLSGKQDPGWPLVRLGIWMMIAGVGILCFRKTSSE